MMHGDGFVPMSFSLFFCKSVCQMFSSFPGKALLKTFTYMKSMRTNELEDVVPEFDKTSTEVSSYTWLGNLSHGDRK